MIYTIANTNNIGKLARVYVDGVRVHRVIMADTDKGVVEYCPDLFNPIASQKTHGEVTVLISDFKK